MTFSRRDVLRTGAQGAVFLVVAQATGCFPPPPPPVDFNVFVDALNGSDDADGLTPETAWRTLAKVGSAGYRTIPRIGLCRGRTWAEPLNLPISGTVEEPLIVGAYGTGGKPVIDGGGTIPEAITGWSKSDVVLQDLKVVGWTDRGIANTNGHRWTIERCEVSGGDGVAGAPDIGIRILGTAPVTVTGTVIRSNTFGRIGTGPSTDLDKEANSFTGLLLQGVEGAQVHDNRFVCFDVVAVRLTENGPGRNKANVIRNNHIESCRGGILIAYSDDTDIRANRILRGRGIGIGVAFSSMRTKIRENLIHDLLKGARMWNGIDISGRSADGEISQNTVARVSRHCLSMADDLGGHGPGWRLYNNIFDASQNELWLGRRLAIGFRGTVPVREDHNVLHGFGAAQPELLANGGFTTVTGSDDDGVGDSFASWVRAGSNGLVEAVTASNADIEALVPSSPRAVKLVSSGGAIRLGQSVSLESGKRYRVRLVGQSAGGAMGVGVARGSTFLQPDGTWSSTAVYDHPAARIGTADTKWTARTLTFVPTATGAHVLHLSLLGTGTVYLDSVSLQLDPERIVVSLGAADGILMTFSQYSAASQQGAGSISEDPLFADPATAKFQLNRGSPARTTGVTPTGAVTYAGSIRPSA